MTLCVAVTTADGLVMGADSMTYVREASLQKSYFNATKIFELHGLPLVVMTYGLGALGRRSIGSLVEEWFEQANIGDAYTVESIAQSLTDFVFERHAAYRKTVDVELAAMRTERLSEQQSEESSDLSAASEEVPEFTDWRTGIVVGGYQPNSSFPFLWAREEPESESVPKGLYSPRPHEEDEESDDGPESGINVWGNDEAIQRLVLGYDTEFIKDLSKDLNINDEAVLAVGERHKWKVAHEGMPIQDAVDYARFLLDVGCGYERFKAGTTYVGGQTDIAVVSRHGIHWESLKPLTEALMKKARAARGRGGALTRDTD